MQYFPSPSATPPLSYFDDEFKIDSQFAPPPRSVPQDMFDSVPRSIFKPMTPPLGSISPEFASASLTSSSSFFEDPSLLDFKASFSFPMSPAPSNDMMCGSVNSWDYQHQEFQNGWSAVGSSWDQKQAPPSLIPIPPMNSAPEVGSSMGLYYQSEMEMLLAMDGYRTFTTDPELYGLGVGAFQKQHYQRPVPCYPEPTQSFSIDDALLLPTPHASVPFLTPSPIFDSLPGSDMSILSEPPSYLPITAPDSGDVSAPDNSSSSTKDDQGWWTSAAGIIASVNLESKEQRQQSLQQQEQQKYNVIPRYRVKNRGSVRASAYARQTRLAKKIAKSEDGHKMIDSGYGSVTVPLPGSSSYTSSTSVPKLPIIKHICDLQTNLNQVCNKEFERVEHLRRHYDAHTGVKVFTCPIEAGRSPAEKRGCSKLFGRHDNLCDHYKTHLRPSTSARNFRLKPIVFYAILLERCDAEHAKKAIAKLEKWRIEHEIPLK